MMAVNAALNEKPRRSGKSAYGTKRSNINTASRPRNHTIEIPCQISRVMGMPSR
jgi:hypothetical protein